MPLASRTSTARLDIISDRHRRVLAILATAAGVLGVITIILVLMRSSAPAAQPEPTQAAVTVIPLPAPPPTVVHVEPIRRNDGTVLLHVTSDPEGATVVLDGERLGVTPFAGRVPVKDAAWLKVRKRDFAAVKTRVVLDKDVDWNVQLRALAE